MQDKSPKIIAYATGASLAAAILVYVFGPTFFPEYNQDRKSAIRRSPSSGGFVGLLNPANDCFINSVLQTLAGLNDLRIFLEFELDRRRSSCNEVRMTKEIMLCNWINLNEEIQFELIKNQSEKCDGNMVLIH